MMSQRHVQRMKKCFLALSSVSTFLCLSPVVFHAEASAQSIAISGGYTNNITDAVKRVKPAVMGIVNYAQISNNITQQTKIEPAGVGTGVLFYKDSEYGYAVTNNHVVEGSVKVSAVLESGKHIQASVVGTDPYTDLAVIRLPVTEVRGIQPVTFCNSNDLIVGEPAIAIGTPMGLDFADSVTAGIVSAAKRIMPVSEPETDQVLDYQAVIQTDAAINPGNSGGPLVNIRGQVMGINSSKIVAPEFEGMGFAIPSNEVVTIANQLLKTGHAIHPALGIEGYSLATLPEQWWPDVPVDYGVWVKAAISPEARASGLQENDVIVAMDNHPVKTMADLRTHLFQEHPGDVAQLRVYRGSRELNLKLKIGKMDTKLTTASPNSIIPSSSSDDDVDPFLQGAPEYGPNFWSTR
ncbi:serine protease Do [Alicyclobacillus tolerans]|uniref:Serine protease Do n=2 Tax=Alicyclobacillus tolerans TaxID=90970 RepID=A0A1M6T121_9BACL|nr:serine protease Do [Alicyclobacillus montanus]